MEIRLIAISRIDGWAFFTKEGKMFLMRPPYLSSNTSEIPEGNVEMAVKSFGFEKMEVSFENVSRLVEYVEKAYLDSFNEFAKNLGIELPSSAELKDILKQASESVLSEYLDKAKNELVPQGYIDAAASLVFDLLELEKVQNNLEMLKKATGILTAWHNKYTQREVIMYEKLIDTWDSRFPYAFKRFSKEKIIELQNAISKRGQLWRSDNR
jgi:hypothetical protein